MQNPNDGTLIPLDSLDDPKRKGKEDWPVYQVGESVCFRGWWWKVVAIVDPRTNPAFIALKPKRRVTENDITLLEIELRQVKEAVRSKG